MKRLRFAVLLLAGGVLGCDDPVRPDSDERPRYDLLFDGEGEDGLPRLHRARDGEGPPELVGSGHAGRRAAASPAGSRIAFQSLGTDVEPPRLMVLDAGSSAPAPLGAVEGLAGEATWASDGRRIAFLSQRDDSAGDIFVAGVSGDRLTGVTNLTPRDPTSPYAQPDRTPAWSPDGTLIAFTAYREGGAAIWVMRPDGTAARPVTAAGDYGDFEPSWSPDGRWIVFQRVDSVGTRIGIVAAAGGAPRFLDWPAKAYNPAWSPDGGRIAFSSDVDGDMDIFVVSPEGVEIGRIRRPGVDRNAAWILR